MQLGFGAFHKTTGKCGLFCLWRGAAVAGAVPAPLLLAGTCVENTDEKPGTFVSAYWASFP